MLIITNDTITSVEIIQKYPSLTPLGISNAQSATPLSSLRETADEVGVLHLFAFKMRKGDPLFHS